MTKPYCSDCAFFDADNSDRRVCRRFPPVATRSSAGFADTVWPAVSPYDWCGEYKPKAGS